MRNVLMDEQHDPAPPWIFLSFLYTLYGQVSGKSSEVAIELSILVSWIATTWLMKVKESQQFQFFASYAIDIHAKKDKRY